MPKKDRAVSAKAVARLLVKQARKVRGAARGGAVDLDLVKKALRRVLKDVKQADKS